MCGSTAGALWVERQALNACKVQQTLPHIKASRNPKSLASLSQVPSSLSGRSCSGCSGLKIGEKCTSEVGHLLLVRGKELRRQGKLNVVGHKHLRLVLLGGRPQRPPGIQIPLVHHVHLHACIGSPQSSLPFMAGIPKAAWVQIYPLSIMHISVRHTSA